MLTEKLWKLWRQSKRSLLEEARMETACAKDELFIVVDALLRMPFHKQVSLPKDVKKAMKWRREQLIREAKK